MNVVERTEVSVVVPCYRSHATLERALDSVIAQSALPSEIIVVDDASDDETPAILRHWAVMHQAMVPVKVILLEQNVGAASARNVGWNAASGEYVAFLDADDTWHPEKLALQLAMMKRSEGGILSGHLHRVAPFPISDWTVPPNPTVVRFFFRDFLWRNRFVTSSVMVRRALPQRFSDGQRYMEDHRLWLEIAAGGGNILRIESELAAHHKPDFGAGGLSGNLVAMERAELGNYLWLHRHGHIDAATLYALLTWSIAKFIRRLFIVAFRRPRAT